MTSSFSRADTLPKKYMNGGLRLYLQANTRRHNTEENVGIGGLNDDDAHATQPNYFCHKPNSTAVHYPAQLQRDATRVNEVLYLLHVHSIVLSLHCPRFSLDQCGPRSRLNRTYRSWVRSSVRADWTHIYRSEVQASVDRT